MITRPFNFEAHLTRPSARLDFVPFFDVCLIMLFFALLGSRFVLAPGISIVLPQTPDAPANLSATSRVVTVSENEGREQVIFEGQLLDLESFGRLLDERAGSFAGEILLVHGDRDVTLAVSARLLNLATRAGFQNVLLATKPEPAVSPASSMP